MTHLWEVDHPYYCSEGNYYARPGDAHEHYASWTEFIEEWGDADPQMNLLVRWDWRRDVKPLCKECEGYGFIAARDEMRRMVPQTIRDCPHCADEEGSTGVEPGAPNEDRLYFYWLGQRKALAHSTAVTVAAEDEPAVREFLLKHGRALAALWQPLLGGGV